MIDTLVKILVVDPQRSIRNVLKEKLEFEGFDVLCTENLEEAYSAHETNKLDIVIIDGRLADEHVASANNGRFRPMAAIILSDSPSIDAAVHAIHQGAFDFVPKPVDMNRLLGAIRNIITLYTMPESSNGTKPVQNGAGQPPNIPASSRMGEKNRSGCLDDTQGISIIGESEEILHVKDLIDRVAPTDARVLITGPNGTGKELVAHSLHVKSSRADGPFIEVNCAAIPSELIESELFGHEKGAFTSAVKQRKGKFEQANCGTLFLDEIGDMSLSAQAKVLRALQENKITRVGSDKDIDVDVRVLAATNKNLRHEIELGNFREDLYHRLSVIVIQVPPLNQRRNDIPLLVNYFIRKISCEYGIEPRSVDKEAIEELQNMQWSGNIRELRNVVERLIILTDERITRSDVKTYASEVV